MKDESRCPFCMQMVPVHPGLWHRCFSDHKTPDGKTCQGWGKNADVAEKLFAAVRDLYFAIEAELKAEAQ